MARREALRELQARLAERLQAARLEERPASWLAVECAGHGLLLPLAQAGEIFSVTPIVRVAHVRPWFSGVVNLRGRLYGVVDLARYLGLEARHGEASRLVVLNPGLQLDAALLVERLAGLRSAEQLAVCADQPLPKPAFVGTRYADAGGRRWQELNLAALAVDEGFMAIAA